MGISRGRVFDDLMVGRDNNFDFLRLMLAVGVIYAHSGFALNRTVPEPDPFFAPTLQQERMGHVGVAGFFAVSGCLVTMSWVRSRGAADFFQKRVLRIYPGFIAAWLFSALVVLPLSGVRWDDFVAMIHPVGWLLKLATLRGFRGIHAFPGNPQHSLNTVLWSIPIEFACYLLVAVLGFVGALRGRTAVVALTVIAYVTTNLTPSLHLLQALGVAGPETARLEPLLESLFWPSPELYFLLGVLVYLYRRELPFSPLLAGLAGGLIVVTSRVPPLLHFALPFCWTYLLFWLAYHPAIRAPRIPRADLSYGLYLYGWPVQQMLTKTLEPYLGEVTLFLLTLPIAAGLAFLSWTFVEEPFLRLKGWRPRPSAASLPDGAPDAAPDSSTRAGSEEGLSEPRATSA